MTARAFLTARLNVYLADFDGARISRPPGTIVGNTIHANRGPAWSRDGRYLAYYSGVMLMIRDVTTGVDRVVPLPANVHCTPLNPGPKWFPDNRSVLIRVRDPEGSGNGFYRFDAESRRSDAPLGISHPTQGFDLSADGRFIYYQGPGSSGTTSTTGERRSWHAQEPTRLWRCHLMAHSSRLCSRFAKARKGRPV